MEYLTHHGVLGMKWGVRRYQNKDGSLTSKGKNRISSEYRKTSMKVQEKLSKNQQKMYVDSYNKAADEMNKGEIEKFNTNQQKKYGDNFYERSGYEQDYMALFEKKLVKYMNISLDDFYKSDNDYQKSKDLINKYGMTEWDEFAKNNEKAVEEVRRTVEKYKKE